MNQNPSGPDPSDWALAWLRGLHPVRWLLCLVGLVATAAIFAVTRWFFGLDAGGWTDWWREPLERLRELGSAVAERSNWAIIMRLALAIVVTCGVWSLIGGWIARHEFIARRRSDANADPSRIKPGPTDFVFRQWKNLMTSAPVVVFLVVILILPMLIAGRLNEWMGGAGAIIVAILLPIVLLADLILLAIGLGMFAFPLMPVTIAAENSDNFDGLSRAYNYAYMRPVRFVLLLGVIVALSAIPLLAVSYFQWGLPVANWLAAAISVSIFWSLQTVFYLDLRMSVDGTDASELAVADDAAADVEPATSSTTASEGVEAKAAPSEEPPVVRRIVNTVQILVFFVGTLWLTIWLFVREGGDNAGWIAWGIGEQFAPPAEGPYRVASILAGLWFAMWLLMPIVVLIRGSFNRAPAAPTPVSKE
jgi:hypothetical protein